MQADAVVFHSLKVRALGHVKHQHVLEQRGEEQSGGSGRGSVKIIAFWVHLNTCWSQIRILVVTFVCVCGVCVWVCVGVVCVCV